MRRLPALLLAVLLALPAQGQQTGPAQPPPPRGFVLSRTGPDSTVTTYRFDPDEPVRVVVRLAAEPLSRVHAAGSGKAGLAAAQATLDAQHRRFLDDLARLDAASSGKAHSAAATQVHATFSVAVNGLAITTRRELLDGIARLDYVTRVEPDREVRATSFSAPRDDDSQQVTGVSRVRSQFGVMGRNVTLAIIDTGIDYTHPDLGGGIGPGFKVLGGYDFVNQDADPMDDNGHGTHVAAIAAGRGTTYPGVAPEARLYAFKVLGADGSGYDSHIIAAVERALDPNGDGSLDDAVDILNASLGGPGHADDAVSEAMDNATAAGVLCVVAAGNEGRYQSIGTPASARRALTVGATDNTDAIAPFSSRGPSAGPLDIKPDVVAPGVAITAAVPGSAYMTLSGTSMASPHVAGAAALLLERFPNWSPDVVKAVFIGTATPLGLDPYTQGAGRVNVFAAMQTPLAVTPGSISLGQVDDAVPTWTRTVSLTLRNLSPASRTFSLSRDGTLPAGISLSLTPSVVTIPAGATVQVTAQLAVVNAQVPYRDPTPPVYSWTVIARSGDYQVRLPLNLLKSSSVRLDLADPGGSGYLSVVGVDQQVGDVFFPYVTGTPILLPVGTYTFEAPTYRMEDDRAFPVLRVKQNVRVSGATTLAFEPPSAAHRVRVQARDAGGQPIGTDYLAYTLTIPAFWGEFTSSGALEGDRVFATTLSENVPIDLVAFSLRTGPRVQYVSQHRVTGGLTAPRTFDVAPADYRKVHYRYAAPPSTDHLWITPGYFRQIGSRGSFLVLMRNFFGPGDPENPRALPAAYFRLPAPFERTVYLTPSPVPEAQIRGIVERAYLDLTPEALPLYETAVVRAEATSMVALRNQGGAYDGPKRVVPGNELTLRVGDGAPYWTSRPTRFGPTLIGLHPESSDLLYAFGTYDRPGGAVQVEQFENGHLKATQALDNLQPFTLFETAGPTRLRARMEGYRVADLPGTVTTEVQFDASANNPNPPFLTDYRLTSGGDIAATLEAGRASALSFTFGAPIRHARPAYRRHGTAAWLPLGQVGSAGPHTLALPDTLPPGYYDLRLVAEDASGGAGQPGNTLAYRAEPAFLFHPKAGANQTPTPARLDAPHDDAMLDYAVSSVVPLRWQASADADPEDRLSYTVRFFGPGIDTTATVWAAPHLDLDLPPVLHVNATYRWTVTTSDGYARVAAVDTFRVRFANATPVDEGEIPTDFGLEPAFPNPFSNRVTLRLNVAAPAHVQVDVFSLLGQRVAVVISEQLPAGQHPVVWEAGALASGVYLCRMRVDGRVFTQKLILAR